MVDTRRSRHSTLSNRISEYPDVRGLGKTYDIQQHADVGLQDGTKGIEEPPMRVDFLLVHLLQAEQDLHGDDALFRAFDLE